MEALGLTPTDAESRLRAVLRRAHRTGFSLQSNFARRHTELVALAASKGLITTKIARDRFGRDWLITVMGLQWLNTTEVNE